MSLISRRRLKYAHKLVAIDILFVDLSKLQHEKCGEKLLQYELLCELL